MLDYFTREEMKDIETMLKDSNITIYKLILIILFYAIIIYIYKL